MALLRSQTHSYNIFTQVVDFNGRMVTFTSGVPISRAPAGGMGFITDSIVVNIPVIHTHPGAVVPRGPERTCQSYKTVAASADVVTPTVTWVDISLAILTWQCDIFAWPCQQNRQEETLHIA